MVEILIVIGIIALLVGLLLPAVLRALAIGPQVQNFSQMAQIESAIGEAKRVLNLDQVPAGPFTLKQYYNGTEPELAYLTNAFPQLQWSINSAGTGLIPGTQPTDTTTSIVLDSNQTLLFFLTGSTFTNFTGFSTNSAAPFTPGKAGDNRKGPFLQMSTKYFVNPANLVPPQTLATTSKTQSGTVSVSSGPNAYPWIMDPYGMPYAYFATWHGKNGAYFAPSLTTNYSYSTASAVQSYTVTLNGKTSTVIPYVGTGGYINPTGVQIISAGKDMVFGHDGAFPLNDFNGFDDAANFSKTLLGGGIN
jgi:hypothetical protein